VVPSGELLGKGRCGVFAGKTVWSTHERLRGEVLTTRRYTNLRLPLLLPLPADSTSISTCDPKSRELVMSLSQTCSPGFWPVFRMDRIVNFGWYFPLWFLCRSMECLNCQQDLFLFRNLQNITDFLALRNLRSPTLRHCSLFIVAISKKFTWTFYSKMQKLERHSLVVRRPWLIWLIDWFIDWCVKLVVKIWRPIITRLLENIFWRNLAVLFTVQQPELSFPNYSIAAIAM